MSTGRGVIAAGHPETANAGAWALSEGANAVDAAVCAVLASFSVESPLTGLGAGGFMLVHDRGENTLIDFFVAAPGKDGTERGAELVPVPVYFDDTPQTF
ncbi:MAG: gamma-glutamyltranspeptidase / glutathione hydrolase, partial [Solirubrobacterales bacterium]|nr:gamma-glutamyltranspeptidase / glutathione hydrolase [Solirubrobacterales bacterium]